MMLLTAAATASLLRAFSCCAVIACALCVTTARISTAVSGSTRVVASPAMVTLVVRLDFRAQPAVISNKEAPRRMVVTVVFIIFPPRNEIGMGLETEPFFFGSDGRTSGWRKIAEL